MTGTTGDTAALTRPDLLGPRLSQATGDERWRQVEASLITGGKSNLTYLLRSPAGELILRRPPSGAILATAHDMKREVRVQRALAGTAVPVPAVDELAARLGARIPVSPAATIAHSPGSPAERRWPGGGPTAPGFPWTTWTGTGPWPSPGLDRGRPRR